MLDNRPFLKKDFAGIVADLLENLRSREGGRGMLTDTTEGSVVRTLLEAFARELAMNYEQLEIVQRSGYLDTADGVALDNVVALLGIERRRAGRIQGSVTLARALPAPENIRVPAGTLVAGRETPLFETVEDATMQQGATQVYVMVRSVEEGQDAVAAGSLSLMHRPVWGIETVTNPSDLLPTQEEETDSELRERARNVVGRASVGTVSALEQAAVSLGFSEVQVQDRVPGALGLVKVVVGDPDISEEEMERLRNAVEEARPAGITVHVSGASKVQVSVAATLELDRERPEHEKQAVEATIKQELAHYLQGLGISENVRWSKVRNILAGNDIVMEVHKTDGQGFMSPSQTDGNDIDSANLILSNGDILIGSESRAVLGQISLALEPPELIVWVDVEIDLAAEAEDISEDDVNDLRENLDSFLGEAGPEGAVSFDDLLARARQEIVFSAIQFTLIHIRDGTVMELRNRNDEDIITDREKPAVRDIKIRRSGI